MSNYYYEEVVRLKLSQNELKRNGIDLEGLRCYDRFQ